MRIITIIIIIAVIYPAVSRKLPHNGETSCRKTSMALTCTKASGHFLHHISTIEISHIYIIESIMDEIRPYHFSSFYSLEVVVINHCSFVSPHENLFGTVTNLRDLKIANSNVTEDICNVFTNNMQLVILNLTGNKIAKLHKNMFGHLQNLEEMDLSWNEIRYIEAGTFEKLFSLKILDLTGNKIGQNFDPSFLTMFHHQCVICKDQFVDCNNEDLIQCEKNSYVDEIWTKLTTGILHIANNPICDLIFQEETNKIPTTSLFPDILIPSYTCKVFVHGQCYRHKSRQYFLMEACGVTNEREFNSKSSSRPLLPVQLNHTENHTEGIFEENKEVNDTPLRNSYIVVEDNQINFFHLSYIISSIVYVCAGFVIGFLFHHFYCKTRGKSPSPSSEEEERQLLRSKIENEHNMNENVNSPDSSRQNENFEDEDENTVLHLAALEGCKNDVISRLTSTSFINYRNKRGETPLHLSVREQKTEIVATILKHFENHNNTTPPSGTRVKIVDIISTTDRNGDSLLHTAAYTGNHKITELLLKHEIDVNATNKLFRTPLHTAADLERFKVVQQLLNKGANPDSSDKEENTPLHLATKKGAFRVVKLLMAHKAKISCRNIYKDTILHEAACHGRFNLLNQFPDIFEQLDINVTNINGETPLMKAAQMGHLETVKFICKKGADLNIFDAKKHTAIFYAAREGHEDVVEYFLLLKAEVNSGGDSPLHAAIRNCYPSIAKVLIQGGADLDAKNDENETPRDLAKEQGWTDLIEDWQTM